MKKQKKIPQNQIIYIIINSIEPYCYEIGNNLALPEGMSYRVRYRGKWMPTIKNQEELEGMNGLLVLRNWNDAKMVPLRKVKIKKVDVVGSVNFPPFNGQIVKENFSIWPRIQPVISNPMLNAA